MTIKRRVEGIGSDIKDQLNSGIQKYVSVSLTLDEFTDIGSTAQLYFCSMISRKLSNLGRTFCYCEFECCSPMAR